MANFEWDRKKAAGNLRNHGVSFEEATHVFNDPLALDDIDDREDYGEGALEHDRRSVTYTLRGGKTRNISARPAEPNEGRRYRDENS